MFQTPKASLGAKLAGWAIVSLVVLPELFFLFTDHTTFLTPGTAWRIWGVGLVFGVPLGLLFALGYKKRLARGLVADHRSAPTLGQVYIAVPVTMFFLVMLWAYMLVAISLWFPGRAPLERVFVVAEVEVCTTRKCGGCRVAVRLRGWPGQATTDVCTDDIQPRVRPGDSLVVRGHFSSLGVHVESVRRASLQSPPT